MVIRAGCMWARKVLYVANRRQWARLTAIGSGYSRGIHIAHTPDGTLQSRTSRLRRPVLQSPMSLIQTQRGQALINLEGSPAICPMSALPVRRGAA